MNWKSLPSQRKARISMRRKSASDGKIPALLCWALFLAAFVGSSVSAEAAAPLVVYVAGNPDLYPIEYYDASAKQYRGLMPDIYRLLSEQTGYTFSYLQPGNGSSQEQMVKNGQAEILSAYREGTMNPQYFQHPISITGIKTKNGEEAINIAFSEIASEKLIADITEALHAISDEEKLAMLVSHTEPNGHVGEYRLWTYLLLGVLLLTSAAAATFFLLWRKKKKKSQADTMLDREYGIGNDQYYAYCFQNLISDKSKALYYIAYIEFDAIGFQQKFGSEECRSVQRYATEFLSRQTTAVEYLARIKDGVYILLYQAANKAAATERIAQVLNELDLYLTGTKIEYSKLFQAGVCALEENMDATAETAFYSANQGYLQAVNEKQPFAFSTNALIAGAHRRESLRRRIMQAISDGEFVIHLQFITDRTGRLFGAEAVSRWQHPQEGLLPPSQYIGMISQSDVITLHDFHIFSLVCKQLESWKNSDKAALNISCNFTRSSLTSSDFSDRIRETVEKYSFDRRKLIIEITEDSLSCDTLILKENIQKCKELGFLIALDDIGSGYSALKDLYNYPIDIVKVEREIVVQAVAPRGKMLLDGLIQLAHSMNMKVLCEGVETSEQNDVILNTDCEYIQGFFYSKTLPLREAEKFLRQHGFS